MFKLSVSSNVYSSTSLSALLKIVVDYNQLVVKKITNVGDNKQANEQNVYFEVMVLPRPVVIQVNF